MAFCSTPNWRMYHVSLHGSILSSMRKYHMQGCFTCSPSLQSTGALGLHRQNSTGGATSGNAKIANHKRTSATSPLTYSGWFGLSVARSTCFAAAGSEMTRKLETGPAR